MEKGGNNYSKGSDKTPKKGPKFNIYWVYAFIGIALLAMNFVLPFSSQPKELSGFKEFQQRFLRTGDVEKLVVVNKALVEVYIKKKGSASPNILK